MLQPHHVFAVVTLAMAGGVLGGGHGLHRDRCDRRRHHLVAAHGACGAHLAMHGAAGFLGVQVNGVTACPNVLGTQTYLSLL